MTNGIVAKFYASSLLLILSLLEWPCVAHEFTLSACQRQFTHSGSASPVNLETINQVDLLRFSAHFTAEGNGRACWDLPFHLDLSQCAGVKLRIRCLNTHLTSQLCIYIQTSDGWQRATITPRATGHWEDIIIPKSDFLPESQANASWKNCTRLRLDAWPSSPGTFVFQLAKLELLNANAPLALLRCGLHENMDDAKRREALRFCQKLGEALASGGIYPAVIDEPDATATALHSYSCVLVPAAEQTGAAATQQLCTYLRQGGHVAAFYALPAKLATAMKLPQGKFTKASALPSPLAQITTEDGARFQQNSGAFMAVPASSSPALRIRAWWVDASGARTQWPAILQTSQGIWMTHVYLNQDPDHAVPILVDLLEAFVPSLRETGAGTLCRQAVFAVNNAGKDFPHTAARKALQQAQKSCQRADYPATRNAVQRVFSELADEAVPAMAHWDEESTRATELRGVWMQSPTGLSGQSWGSTLLRLSQARFNAVFPRFLMPYGVAWRSNTTARLTGIAPASDPVSECLAAAKNYGIQVHAWACLLSIEDAPAAIQRQFAQQDLLQRTASGKQVMWLCPSRKFTHDLLLREVRELVRNYALDGLQFDMLRYQGSETCHCDTCRELFVRYLKHRPENWPAGSRVPQAYQKQWEAFRCHQIAQLLQELSEAAHAIRPSLRISAAVYPELSTARRNVGQDWQAWLTRQYIAFVCPMNYQAGTSMFQGNLTQQSEALGTHASEQLIPGIGVTPKSLTADETRRQIQATRNAGLNGFILFEYNAQSAQAILPFLMR
ncbi:MAG: family 10 glycosylhydrolase [Victivallales bacterium]|nr:family 10 glycosylhydrolase [Victivallales bacterium]